MKPKTTFIVILSLILSSGIAMAGPDTGKNLNFVDIAGVRMPGAQYETLKAMIIGRYTPRAGAVNRSEPVENISGVSMPLAEINTLEGMVAGTYVAPSVFVDRRPEMVIDLGVELMSKSEYETLKAMVSDTRCVMLPPVIAHLAHCPIQ